jgi:hypothetical protein
MSQSPPYDRDGPISVMMFQRTVTATAGTGAIQVNVFLPMSAGPHPVVSLSPGVQQVAEAYAPYAKRLASYGIVTLTVDDPGALTDTTRVTANIAYQIGAWLPAENTSTTSMLHGQIDLSKAGLAGHSRGGKASLIAAETPLKGKVNAWFGIDPVDSAALGSGVLARDHLSTVGIPTTFLGATVSGACSPAPDNYEVLYGLAPSPSTKITAIGAGHVEFEDPASCVLCGLCAPAGTAPADVVLAYSVRYLTAFFARELLGDSSVGADFSGAGGPADVAAGRVMITTK